MDSITAYKNKDFNKQLISLTFSKQDCTHVDYNQFDDPLPITIIYVNHVFKCSIVLVYMFCHEADCSLHGYSFVSIKVKHLISCFKLSCLFCGFCEWWRTSPSQNSSK